MEKNTLKLHLVVSETVDLTNVYLCVMHHPLRSAETTPISYPVDEIHIMHNGILTKSFEFESSDMSDTIVDLTTIDLTTSQRVETLGFEKFIDVGFNEKVVYDLPIYDAMESWDFVVSKEPINVEDYIDSSQYLKFNENVFKRKKDLIEQEKRESVFKMFEP